MDHATSDAKRIDDQLAHHANPLDDYRVGPELPKDALSDHCLDGIAQFREQMRRDMAALITKGAGIDAILIYLQGIIRKGVEAGAAEWMEQENDPGSCARGEEAALIILQTVTGTLMGEGGYVRASARQIAMHGYALLFALGRTRMTETQIAEKFGYTRANVSATVRQYKRKFDLRQSRGMKSDRAVEVYRQRAKQVHNQRKETQNQCKTTNSSFNKFWTSTSNNSKPLKPVPSN